MADDKIQYGRHTGSSGLGGDCFVGSFCSVDAVVTGLTSARGAICARDGGTNDEEVVSVDAPAPKSSSVRPSLVVCKY